MPEPATHATPETLSPRQHAGLLFVYLLLTCVMTFPVCFRISGHVPGAGDPLLTCWYLDRNMDWYTGQSDGPFYDSQLLYPYPATAAYSEHFIGTSLLALPLRILSGDNPIAVYNLVFLGGFLFAAYGAHLLAYHFTRRHIAGVTAAIVFAFVPFRIDHIVHLHMVTAAWVPFAILFLSRYLRAFRRLDLAGFAFCFLMNALSSCFYMIALCLILLLVFPWLAWPGRGCWKRMVSELAVTLLLVGTILIVVYKPYLEVQESMGFERDVRENVLYSARLQSWLGVPGWQANSLLYGEGRLNFERFTSPECALFPGILACVALLLTMGICIRERKCPGWLAAMSGLVVIGFILSFGPWFNRDPGNPNYLFQAVFSFFPGASSMRTPARYAFLVYTGLAMLTGYATCLIQERQPAHRAKWVWLAPFLLLIEYAAMPLHTEKLPDPRMIPEHVVAMMSDHPAPVFIEYPLGSDVLNREVTFSAISHDLSTVNGYTSFYPPAHHELMESDQRMLTEEGLTLLETLGVSHLVADRSFCTSGQRKQLEAFAVSHPERIHFLGRFNKKELYRLPRALPADELLTRVSVEMEAMQCLLPAQFPEDELCVGRVVFGGIYPELVDSMIIPLFRQGEIRFDSPAERTPHKSKVSLAALRHDAAAPFRFRSPASGTYSPGLALGAYESFAPSADVRVTPSFPDVRESVGVLVSDVSSVTGRTHDVVTISVRIRNEGATYWPSYREGETGEVRVGYRLRQNGGVLKEMRARLPYDVAPGEEVDVTLEFRAPPAPGEYEVWVSMLAENITWFDAKGTIPLVVSLRVQ